MTFNLVQAKDSVRNMMAAYGQSVNTPRGFVANDAFMKLADFRSKFNREELEETKKAVAEGNDIEFVDGLCDVMVVSVGACIAFGLDAYGSPFYSNFAEQLKIANLMNRQVRQKIPDAIRFKNSREEAKHVFTSFAITLDEILNRLDEEIEAVKHYSEDMKEFFDEHGFVVDEDFVGKQFSIGANRINNYLQEFHDLYCGLFLALADIDPSLRLQENFDEVMDSNMRKFCKDTAEAEATKAKYEAEGTASFYEAVEGTSLFRVRRQDNGKMLKAVSWSVPAIKLDEPIVTEAGQSSAE